MVYGIPRSTLRNKIYKLEATDEDQVSAIIAGASSSSPAKSSSRKADKSKAVSDSAAVTDDQKMDESSLAHELSCASVIDAVCGRTTTSSEDSSTSLSSSGSSNDVNAFGYVDPYGSNWTTSAAGLTGELAKRQALEALWRTATPNGTAGGVFSNEITAFSSPIVNGSAAVKVRKFPPCLQGKLL